MPHHADGRVFPGPFGGILKPDTVRNVLIREVVTPLKSRWPSADGEPGFEDGRRHSFRHYFCSQCADSQIPEQMLMVWLGHEDSKMVKRYYHVQNEVAWARMNNVVFTTAESVLGDITTEADGPDVKEPEKAE